MKRTVALFSCTAAAVTAAVAVFTLSMGSDTRTARTVTSAAFAQRAPVPALPAAAVEIAPVAVAAARPTPFDAPRASDSGDAEQRLALALDRIERTVASVVELGDPPPTDHEARRLREDAVEAYLDMAPHLSAGEREQRFASIERALAPLAALDGGGHPEVH